MSNETPTGTADATAMTVHEAAQAFEAMMTPREEDKSEGDDEQPQAEAEVEAPQGEETEAEGAESEGEESAQDPESDEPGEEEEQAAEAEADPTFTVKIDGKDETVTLSELQAGYSRTSDYTRKTQKLADERKAFAGEVEATRGERAEYATLLPKLRAALEAGLGPEPNWAELRANDPAGAAAAWQEREERKAKIAAVKNQERIAADRAARDHQIQSEQVAVEQHNLLLEKLPSWRDPKVAAAESEKIAKSLQAMGFSGKELEIYDHRAMLVARKAALYDEIMEQRKNVQKVVKKVPVAKPGAPTRKTTVTERQKADRSRLAKTGNVKDAARIFESFLPD